MQDWIESTRRDGGIRFSSWVTVGAALAALSVATGAIAAHGIDRYLAENYEYIEGRRVAGQVIPAAQKYLEDFNTASRYQMYHAIGIMLTGVLVSFRRSRLLTTAAWCHLAGILMFCGSLYVLALTAHSLAPSARHSIGLIAASGGMAFIIGWGLLAAGVCACRSASLGESES